MRQVSSAGRVRSAILLYASIFMFMRIILVATAGKQSAAYAGPALELCLLFLVTIPYAVSVCLSRLIKSRMRRQRYSSIRILYKTALLFSIAAGLIAGGLTAVLNVPLSLLFGGEAHMYLCFLCAAPFFVITSAFGAFGGFYQGVRITPPAITSILAEAVLTCILSPLFANLLKQRGVLAGALLRDDSYPFVYAAAGVLLGADLAALIALIYWLSVRLLTGRRLLRDMPDSAQREPESRRYLSRTLFTKIFLLAAAGFISFLPVLTDYRILHASVNVKTDAMVAWGSYYAKTLPILAAAACLLILPFTGYCETLARYYRDGDIPTLRSYFGMMMRLAGYVLLPFSFFFIAAAEPVTAIIGNARDAAASVSMQINGILILLAGIDILLAFFYIEIDRTGRLALSAGIAYIVQTLVCTAVSRQSDPGITVCAVPLLSFFIALTILLFFFMKEELVAGNRYFKAYLLMAVCAIAASIPVYILAQFLERETGFIAASIISFILYAAVYIVMSLFTGAADLRNIDRLPGGNFLLSLADLFNL